MEIRSRIGSKKIPVKIIFTRFKNVNIFKRLLPKSCRFKILTQKKFCFKLSGMPEIFLDVEKIFNWIFYHHTHDRIKSSLKY